MYLVCNLCNKTAILILNNILLHKTIKMWAFKIRHAFIVEG